MKLKNLIIVGGSNRNVGKTEFICRIISRFSQNHSVIALKVSGVAPSYNDATGNEEIRKLGDGLFEEIRTDTNKDTSRMLQSGATRVMYLHSEDNSLQERFSHFMKHAPENIPIVCESNNLGKIITPALSIVIKDTTQPVKERAITQISSADLVIKTDGTLQFQHLQLIDFSPTNGWSLKVENE